MTNGQFLEHGITFPLTEGQILKSNAMQNVQQCCQSSRPRHQISTC